MNLQTTIILFLAIAFVGCSDTVSVEPSKEEIKERKVEGDSKDYCEIFNWYGDGKCDDFCQKEDSDCVAQCGAVPVCLDGTLEVPECFDAADCETLSLCGTTIHCQQPDCDTTDADGVQDCGPGYILADECDNSDPELPCIELVSECADTVYCNPEPAANCFAFPTCTDATFPVESCKLGDTECSDVEVCGETISCTPNRDCAATVMCNANESSYRSRAECEDGSEACRQDYVCNSVIWCGGNDACAPPTCGARPEIANCQDPEKCVERSGCGVTVYCEI